MKRRFLLLGLLALLGALATVSDGSAVLTTPVKWNNALKVPGMTTLSTGDGAKVYSISCAATGNCSAGGYFRETSGNNQAFIVDETNGIWGKAVKVPGTASLNAGGQAFLQSVSCASTRNCAAGGAYEDGSGHDQAFVVSKTNGTWGKAVEAPGTAALNAGGTAGILSVSCATAGNCSAGGYYKDGSGHTQAFVVSETNGTWGTATEVPGTAALNAGGNARVYSISCAAVDNCAASGAYEDGTNRQAFVVNETNGTWGNATEIPGTATLNAGGSASGFSISCGAAGDCAAGGYYKDGSDQFQAFVVSETNGTWGNAIEVPGTAALNVTGAASVQSVSCGAAGDCAAGGYYADASGNYEAFVVSATHGTWGSAIEVPGTATLNAGDNALVSSISCAAARNCSAGGYYYDGSNQSEPFVVSETNGTWRSALEVPGIETLNVGGQSQVYALSCAAVGACAAGGYYRGGASDIEAFVVNSKLPPCVVPNVLGKRLGTAKRKLKAAHCGVGRITSAYSKVPKGRVAVQKPRAGKHLRNGAKVALTLSRGRRP